MRLQRANWGTLYGITVVENSSISAEMPWGVRRGGKVLARFATEAEAMGLASKLVRDSLER